MTTCAVCKHEWTGKATAHCSTPGCHQTFGSYSSFVEHQDVDYDRDPAVRCLAPEDVGLEWRDRCGGIWVSPMDERQAARIASFREASQANDGLLGPDPTQTLGSGVQAVSGRCVSAGGSDDE